MDSGGRESPMDTEAAASDNGSGGGRQLAAVEPADSGGRLTPAGMFVSGWEGNSGSDDGASSSRPPADTPAAALLQAAERGELPTVCRLLDEHGDALANCSRDSDGYTPLHRAAYNERERVVQALLARGADPAAATNERWRPLHSAACWASVGAARVLLQHAGTDVNARTDGGLTALHLAAQCQGQRDKAVAVNTLLLSVPNVDTAAVTAGGDTAKQIARRNCRHVYELYEHL